MVSDTSIPWYNRPSRPFPVHLWMRQRYGFRVLPLRFAPQASQPERASDQREREWPNPERPSAPGRRPEGPRPFPAKVWLERRKAGG